jgi:hypothetical protein
MHAYRIAALSLVLVWSADQAQPERVNPSRVTVESVTKVLVAKSTPAYLVSYAFDFDGLPKVRIEGIGEVSSKGKLQHLTVGPTLSFFDPTNNALLERVALEETAAVASKAPFNEVPPERDFPKPFRAFTWDIPSYLYERANTVFAPYFENLPYESNKLTYIATTFTRLPLDKGMADSGVQARVALLLSYPYATSGSNGFSVHVQVITREGRALSDDLRDTTNEKITKAANEFVSRLIDELKTGR